MSAQRNSILLNFRCREADDIADGFVDTQPLFVYRGPFCKLTDPLDNIARSIAVIDDTFDGLSCLLKVWRFMGEPTRACISVGHDRGQWLVDFMGDRSR